MVGSKSSVSSTTCSTSRTCRGRAFTDLSPLLEAGLRSIKRRSLIFVISDFISTPGWDRPLGLLSQRHEVVGVRLWDPREMTLPDIGPMIVEDAETGEQVYIDTHDRAFRERFREAAREREIALGATFARTGAQLMSLSTDEDLIRAIVRLATRRQRRRQ